MMLGKTCIGAPVGGSERLDQPVLADEDRGRAVKR